MLNPVVVLNKTSCVDHVGILTHEACTTANCIHLCMLHICLHGRHAEHAQSPSKQFGIHPLMQCIVATACVFTHTAYSISRCKVRCCSRACLYMRSALPMTQRICSLAGCEDALHLMVDRSFRVAETASTAEDLKHQILLPCRW